MTNKPSLSLHGYVRYLGLIFLFLIATSAQADNRCVPVGSVLLPATDEQIGVVELINSMADKRVVLLGEHHDNVEHHRWQLQMITGLHTLNPDMVLGFEMFSRQVQPVLDKWVAGELTEEVFLEQVNWEEYWSFDARLYLPLFHYARMNRIPMYALNVERSLVREVGRQGWDNVSEAQREGITKPAPPSEGYRQMLATVFMQHGENHEESDPEKMVAKAMAMPGFTRFVESQQVWDRAMAEGVAKGLKDHPEAQFVAVLGSGHMMYHFGVPEQLTDLGMPAPAALVPWDPEFQCDYIQQDFADAVIGLKAFRFSQQQSDDHPRLGVYLGAAEGGVLIQDIVPESIAAELGLKKGDVIVRMAGSKVEEVGQVIDIVKATRFGTWLPFAIMRDEKVRELVAKFPPEKQTK